LLLSGCICRGNPARRWVWVINAYPQRSNS
jgi:hypothetical protein